MPARGRADDGKDLVNSVAGYIRQVLPSRRAAERVTLELGRAVSGTDALMKEVEAERWTSLDRSLRDISG